MQNIDDAAIVSVQISSLPEKSDRQLELNLEAEKLLQQYQTGQQAAIELFKTHHPAGKQEGFSPALLDARQVIMFRNMNGQSLSLERLKKSAKKLLRDFEAGDAVARHRISSLHPKARTGTRPPSEMSLVDMQHVLALENGFASWPKLKHHLQDMNRNARLIKEGKAFGTEKCLHIRCGNDIRPALEDASIKGGVLEVINPFTMGPVLPDRLEPHSLKMRTEYLEAILGPYVSDEMREGTRDNLIKEEETLLKLGNEYEEVTLWFEHDAYDQLCLAYILHHMARKSPRLPFKLKLVQVDRFPGIKRFVGIGQIGQPEGFALLFEQRIDITPPMISFGATIWEAFTDKDPTALWDLISEQGAPLPLMQKAFWRILAELPSPQNGLGLTERLALDIIAKEGTLLARRAFLFSLADRDPQPYHGDIMFYATLKSLWKADKPALEVIDHLDVSGEHGKEVLSLTPYGEQLLHGNANWLQDNETRKWVGGIEINSRFSRNWHYVNDTEGPKLL